MTSNSVQASTAAPQPDSLVAPLPNLTLVQSVGKLDAGLRSLDHCEQLLFRPHDYASLIALQIGQNCHYGATYLVSSSFPWCAGRRRTLLRYRRPLDLQHSIRISQLQPILEHTHALWSCCQFCSGVAIQIWEEGMHASDLMMGIDG
jgi:hypothetical protein